ncbi:hypothetical protein AV530_017322 [Patagioenas fasciata monilis]|uniref:Uncharacterized protein n=1 Tax=Patagioenas fasciata monilis TaxID=372326 RepID=A0A1V4JFL8_PATFA|nr:hypothetical protein AV530_017322 [Patagioenas fasciata monilis]
MQAQTWKNIKIERFQCIFRKKVSQARFLGQYLWIFEVTNVLVEILPSPSPCEKISFISASILLSSPIGFMKKIKWKSSMMKCNILKCNMVYWANSSCRFANTRRWHSEEELHSGRRKHLGVGAAKGANN